MPEFRPPAGNRAGGFILLACIGFLAVLVLLVSAFALWVERALKDAQDQQDALQFELDAQSTQAALLYRLSTQRFTAAGLSLPDRAVPPHAPVGLAGGEPEYWDNYSLAPDGTEIGLDGRLYRGVGQALFAIQDEGGLLNLRSADDRELACLLQGLGVARDALPGLLSALRDYTDSDPYVRLNGAEAREYRQAGLMPPRDAPLLLPTELMRVHGWTRALPAERFRELFALTASTSVDNLNVNTAPREVLRCRFGGSEARAEAVLQGRQRAPFSSMAAVQQMGVNSSFDSANIALLASVRLRLWLLDQDKGKARVVSLRLTPKTGKSLPWSIEYAFDTPAPHALKELQPLENSRLLPPAALSDQGR